MQHGALVVAVTMAEPSDAQAFCGPRAPGVLCLSDPAKQAFRAFGIGQAGPAELLNPDVFWAGMQATIAGHMPGIPVGDPLQMPATFIIAAGGQIQLAYYSKTVADHPDNALLIGALARL
jgi:peroxiredoxin